MRYLPAVLIALLALAPAAEAGSSKPTCSRSGSKTVASNTTVRVYTKLSQRDYFGDVLYACLKRTGRHLRLAENYDDELYQSTTFDKVRLNGRFVAWESTAIDVSCKADCPPGYEAEQSEVHAADARSRRIRSYPGEPKDVLLLTRGGTPAWLEDVAGAVQVRAGARVLDSGAIEGLALSGFVLRWTNAGEARSATLR